MIDSALTFLRPKASYYLGLALGVLALVATLSQPEHYFLVASGNLLPAATIILGSLAQVLLIILASYYLVSQRKKDPWAWPGAKSQA